MSSIDFANEFGECQLHNRPFECFSLDSKCLICPSCLMFGPNKGDKVCSIEDAGKDLRAKMDDAARSGLFKVEKTESVLLDIRQTKLNCEEGRQKVLKEVDEAFSKLIKKLKSRREEVLKDIESHYEQQFSLIDSEEKKWTEKQDISVKLLQLGKGADDSVLITNAKVIHNGIEILNQPLAYHVVKILKTMDTNLKYSIKQKNQGDLSLKEFINALETYVQKGEISNVQFRS